MKLWQQQGQEDEWVFGECIRGVIRKPLAEVYFYDRGEDYGWRWIVLGAKHTPGSRPLEASLGDAIERCEAALGHDLVKD